VLGLFDSGLGGLTVLRRLRELLPRCDVLYFADQAHVPYGDRSVEDLRGLLRANVAWLNERGCEAIVMACNTSCAVAGSYGWPASHAPIFDLIAAAGEAVARCGAGSIAVAATTATVRAGAYARAIHARSPGTRVTEVAAPALVPLVESGAARSDLEEAVAAVCSQFPADVDALVYGCTHYPLLDDIFARSLPEGTLRIDPAIWQARSVAAAGYGEGDGRTRYVTSGALALFAKHVAAFDGGAAAIIEGI
jgi:glutamate racemase